MNVQQQASKLRRRKLGGALLAGSMLIVATGCAGSDGEQARGLARDACMKLADKLSSDTRSTLDEDEWHRYTDDLGGLADQAGKAARLDARWDDLASAFSDFALEVGSFADVYDENGSRVTMSDPAGAHRAETMDTVRAINRECHKTAR